MDCLLINKDDFCNWVDLSRNIKQERLFPHIIDAQIRIVAPAICQSVYEEVLEQFESHTLTPENQSLLKDYIVPLEVFASYVNYLSAAGKVSTATGMVKIIGDNKEQVTREELKDLIEDNKNKRLYYENRVVNYLKCNKETYPLYSNCCKPKKTGFSITGIESGQRRLYKELDKYYRTNRDEYYDEHI